MAHRVDKTYVSEFIAPQGQTPNIDHSIHW